MAVSKRTIIKILLICVYCILAISPLNLLYQYHYHPEILYLFKYPDENLWGAVLICLLGITIVSISKKFNATFWISNVTNWIFYFMLFVVNITLSTPMKIDTRYINKTDSSGAKSGYWCETHENDIWVCFYENGEKNGLAQRYARYGKNQYFLSAFGCFEHDRPAQQWQYYHANGMISTVITEISENHEFMEEAEKAYRNPESTLQGYVINYNREGKIISEGWCIFYSDCMKDGAGVGIWKCYRPEGMSTEDRSLELKPLSELLMIDDYADKGLDYDSYKILD